MRKNHDSASRSENISLHHRGMDRVQDRLPVGLDQGRVSVDLYLRHQSSLLSKTIRRIATTMPS
tara:strand:- start:190 stop:381 length:192 start_codon:yes stop_codon:yes gene_type:complete